jgi:hypothetical protein
MTTLQKALDALDDLSARLAKIEAYRGPLWLQQLQGQARPASASPSPVGMIPAPVLSKAVLGLPAAVDAAAVLAGLMSDPVLGTYVREKINRANF